MEQADLKPFFVSDLAPDSTITSVFLVARKDVRQKKDGASYLSFTLSDRSGQIEAVQWEPDALDVVERDDFARVRAAVTRYRDKLQLTIERMRRVEESEVTLGDYLPATTADVAALMAELRQRIAGMKNRHLQALLQAIFDDGGIAERYSRAPAAKSLHHAYLGGLLEHVTSLCRLAELVVQNYPEIDRDLLITGILLHDLGKIEELSYRRSFAYTTDGQLLGHMILGLEIVQEKLRALPDFPRRLRSLLEHLIISHHGKYEFGSPKLPMFPEALLLHQLDDLDSKMQAMRTQLQQEPAGAEPWTSYNRSLERPLLRVAQWLEEPDAGDAAADSRGAAQ